MSTGDFKKTPLYQHTSLRPFEPVFRTWIWKNPYWEYRFDYYRLPSGKLQPYHYVHTPGSVLVIPLLDPDTFLMVQQYRYLHQRLSIEFPGGGRPQHQSYTEAAQQELCEETGYRAAQLQLLGRFNPCNGVMDEICHVFLATELTYSPTASPDQSEALEVRTVSSLEFRQLVTTGAIWDGMTLAAYTLFLLHATALRQTK